MSEETQVSIINTHWKPEWDKMPESERMKDLDYTTMLHAQAEDNYNAALKALEECHGKPCEALAREMVDRMKGLLDLFRPVVKHD